MRKEEVINKVNNMKCPNDKCTNLLNGSLIAQASEDKYYVACRCCGAVSRAITSDDKVLLSITPEKHTEEIEIAKQAFAKEFPYMPIVAVATSKEAERIKELEKASRTIDPFNCSYNEEDYEDYDEYYEEEHFEDCDCDICYGNGNDDFFSIYEDTKDYIVTYTNKEQDMFPKLTKEQLGKLLTTVENKTSAHIDKIYEVKEVSFNRKVLIDF